MTKIVTIGELYSLIPETKKLEGVNFANLKQLLESVITAAEQSGKWIFVQYISGQPSLFIVREKEVVVIPQAQSNVQWTPDKVTQPSKAVKKETSKAKNPAAEEVMEKEEQSPAFIPSNEPKLFAETKMPW